MEEETHEGHRKRLRDKYILGGPAALGETGVLELLLTYALPRRDVLPLAKSLIARFGTLENVFAASVGTLLSTGLLSENAAVFIHLAGERAYLRPALSGTSSVPDDNTAAGIFAEAFKGADKESVYVLCLNKDRELLYRGTVFEGDINSVRFRIRDVTEPVVYSRAELVYLGHNHISGSVYPSGFDLDTTRRIADSLASNDAELLEHFIVCGTSVMGVKEATSGAREEAKKENGQKKEEEK